MGIVSQPRGGGKRLVARGEGRKGWEGRQRGARCIKDRLVPAFARGGMWKRGDRAAPAGVS